MCEKEKLEIEQLLEHFRAGVSEEVKDFTINTALKSSRYLFIRKEIYNMHLNGRAVKQKRYFAYCTHCKKEYEISGEEVGNTIKHNHYATCEKCGSECMVKYERYGRSTLDDRAIFITYEKSVLDSDVLVARGYFVSRDYSGDYKKVRTEYRDLSRYIFQQGKSIMITKWTSSGRWGKRNGCYSYVDGYGNYRSYVDTDSILRAIENTRFMYSHYKRYMKYGDDMTNFFYVYNKYPIIEKLVKMGFEKIANSMVYGRSLERAVRWKQTDVFKFLKLNRAEVKAIKESGIDCYPDFLKLYQINIEDNSKYSPKEIEEIKKKYGNNIWGLVSVSKYSKLRKCVKYLEKQKNKYGKDTTRSGTVITYKDYLDGCKKLDMNMKDEHVLFPKDVYTSHDNIVKQIEIKKSEILDRKIKSRLNALEKYTFQYKDYLIRVAESSGELIEEGKKLGHCVATHYLKPYAEGRTIILLIREKDKPNTPLVTVEVKRKEVIQAYGIRNTRPKKEVIEFIEEYKKSVLNKLKKKYKKIA